MARIAVIASSTVIKRMQWDPYRSPPGTRSAQASGGQEGQEELPRRILQRGLSGYTFHSTS